nr:nucleotidyltransferase domain-containing protein [Synechococcus sp. PCC 7336]
MSQLVGQTYNSYVLAQNLFEKGEPKQVKPLLYVYRVLLTGIHLMRSGVTAIHYTFLEAG